MPFLHSPSRIINPLARERRFGFGSGMSGGESFLGSLDFDASRIVRCWCPGKRLLSGWTGNAGTLRETTGSTEDTFGYLADGYLNTSAVSAFLTGAGASAAAWKVTYDQKASGDDLTQTNAANQPLYVASHSGFNNRACIHLDSAIKGMVGTLNVVRPYSIVVVEDDDGVGSARTVTAYTGTGGFVNNLICANRGGLTVFRGGSVSTAQTAAACVTVLTGPSSGNHAAYCNGSNTTTGTVASGDWQKIALGKAPSPGGTEGAITKVFALLVYNIALSAGDVAAIQTALAPASL